MWFSSGRSSSAAKKKVFREIFLPFAPFARAALSRERVVRCFSNCQQLDCSDSLGLRLSFFKEGFRQTLSLGNVARMPKAREEDKIKQVPISLKNVSPTISKTVAELKELIEDLTRMGCEGILSKPWSLRSEGMLREFLFERGN